MHGKDHQIQYSYYRHDPMTLVAMSSQRLVIRTMIIGVGFRFSMPSLLAVQV